MCVCHNTSFVFRVEKLSTCVKCAKQRDATITMANTVVLYVLCLPCLCRPPAPPSPQAIFEEVERDLLKILPDASAHTKLPEHGTPYVAETVAHVCVYVCV
jgi:hypothetical protein